MIHQLFPPKYDMAPPKKFRGKKRYFRKLIRDADEFSPALANNDWYDMWHYHADWDGYGNLGWKIRRKHIEALCLVYQTIVDGLKDYRKPHQIWIYLNQDDSGYDAVYFHTQNPNRENFPFKFSDAQWGIPIIEHFFSELIPSINFRSGKQEREGSQNFFIYSPEIGEPIE